MHFYGLFIILHIAFSLFAFYLWPGGHLLNSKSGISNPKRNKPLSISGYMDPTLNINSQPTNGLENCALGNMYKIVHQGANKCISNVSVLQFYDTAIGMVKEYHDILKNSTELSKAPEMKDIHPPPHVCLNNHNIVDVQKVLFEVSQT